MKIYLSPSTQENNKGYGNYGTEEKRMNDLADILEIQLVMCGHKVFRNKSTMTLAEVVKHSNSFMPDIHVAIHSDASSGNVQGSTIFCHKFGGNGEKLARLIEKHLNPITPAKDRGVKEGYKMFGEGKPLYELANTTAPAVLVEVSFHDNKIDSEWIINNLDVISSCFVDAINDYSFTVINEIVVDKRKIDYKAMYDELLKKYLDLKTEIQNLIIKYQN